MVTWTFQTTKDGDEPNGDDSSLAIIIIKRELLKVVEKEQNQVNVIAVFLIRSFTDTNILFCTMDGESHKNKKKN